MTPPAGHSSDTVSDLDEAECEELPPVTVTSAVRGKSRGKFAMPPAGEVASQRARAERCEAALRRLRARSEPGEPCAPAAAPALLARSDSTSSGSEGEAPLAAAITGLRVRASRRPALPPLCALLAAAGSPLPRPLLDCYARAAPPAPAACLAARTLKRLAAVTPRDEERGAASEAAVWLCLAQCAAERRTLGTLRVARGAQVLLEEAPGGVAARLLGALQEPRERLRLADALRGDARGVRGAALAASLEAGALAALDARGASSPAGRCLRLQLEGRARARGAPAPPAPAPARARDSMQVLAATTKLHMLFPASGNSDS